MKIELPFVIIKRKKLESLEAHIQILEYYVDKHVKSAKELKAAAKRLREME